MNARNLPTWTWAAAVLLLAGGAATALVVRAADGRAAEAAAPAPAKPALSVAVATPERVALPTTVAATGNVAAWQEAVIGSEANGWRLAEVRVNVGDRVRRGQVLATFAAALPQADLAAVRAQVAEAEALLADARANAERARGLAASGALSAQQINQYLTAESTAAARLEALRAAAKVQELRLAQAQVLAPDDGVISSRSATVGAVVGAGQELFRLIRGGRLEWRAEVAADDLAKLAPGQRVRVQPAGGAAVEGRVRMVGPTVDPATRNGLVYVDLPRPGAARAGMFARGDFELGSTPALTLPAGAVLLRDGFAWVFKVGADGRVEQAKVTVGRRSGERVEITGGLDAAARIVASGGSFLADGDLVRVVEAPVQRAAAGVPATGLTR
ncbi:MAG: efflux RND transporter periplasmic adaptor subunit [Rubrivivax sp.]|nr:efflux RND transporter periplasmic adaptor subunit [Rubrivivax sp.]